jgi:hypothetical protein
LGNQNKPSLAKHMGNQIYQKTVIGGLGRRRLGLSNTLFVLLCSGLNVWDTIGKQRTTIIGNIHGEPNFRKKNYHWGVGAATIGVERHTFRTTVFGFEWVGHHWKTKNNHHWQHAWRTQFPKRLSLGVGVATIGVEQHTFRTTVFGFEWAGHHWRTKTNHHWQYTWRNQFPKKNYHWGVGLATIGVEQHMFLNCTGVCWWVWDHWKTEANHHWQHTWGTTFSKKKLALGRLGERRLGLSNTLFVLLYSV